MEEQSIYRRAKPWQIRLYTLAPGGIGNCFYLLMMYVSYIANVGYGIAVAVAGIIMTATRIFDGVTDPICAFISDRISTKYGKIRILLAIGWAIMALSCWLMFIGGIGGGIVYFIVVYCLYIVGYTITSVASNIATPVITNDPKQRPLLARWQNIWTMATMMVLNMVVAALFLPRFNNEYNLDCLQAMFYLVTGVSLVYLIISCIAVSEADKPENFEFGKKEEKQKLKIRDCWEMIKGNRALQMYIVAAASDKLALQTAGNTIFTTMLFGILIGNMTMSVIGSALSMPVSIIAAILATKMARTRGNKNALVWWTWFAIASAAACAVAFFLVPLSQVFKAAVPTVIFVLLRFVLMPAGQNGASSCTGAMMADIADYEAVRTGNFLPGTVAACYSFVDKFISSFSSTIATLSVAAIGYTTVMPQPNDPASTPILILTIIMTLGMPILGWLCTIFAMKFYPLTTEKMVEVQTKAHEIREAANQPS